MLISRVADGDRAALRLIYAALCEPVTQLACRALRRADDVRAVVHATFVEVWWMARFHSGRALDGETWILGIAARRAADRGEDHEPSADLVLHDETNRITLDRLLRDGPRLAVAGRGA